MGMSPARSGAGRASRSLDAVCAATAVQIPTSCVCCRMVIVANHLPLRAIPGMNGEHDFEWDEDDLIGQAKVRAIAQ